MKQWPPQRTWPKRIGWGGLLVVGLLIGWVGWHALASTSVLQPKNRLVFDSSVNSEEQKSIKSALEAHQPAISKKVQFTAQTSDRLTDRSLPVATFVLVANHYASLTDVSPGPSLSTPIYVSTNTSASTLDDLAKVLKVSSTDLATVEDVTKQLDAKPAAVGLIPINQLSPAVKLLTLNGKYYLDDFVDGAIFRTVTVSGPGADQLSGIRFINTPSRDSVLKVNMSGVTALTRQLMLKIQSSQDPAYPAKNIGKFLGDADLTHTSDEVSFKAGCAVSSTSFCAPPDSIKALEASGIDLVELTGNHNNDSGTDADAVTVKTFHGKSWGTFGGGLNAAEAAKPFVADKKHSKVTFLGYNYYDTKNPSEALATATTAGANSYDVDKIKTDIATAKSQGEFVIVDLQYQECYAYPDGYQLMPECYKPLDSPDQKGDFRNIIDLGADMVVGTQAHQPQTYEFYKGKPIYYGLGNLFFDQVDWPGTEQGMILSHYFSGGKLLQTKLSPTVYDKAMQPRLMNTDEARNFLTLLNQARP